MYYVDLTILTRLDVQSKLNKMIQKISCFEKENSIFISEQKNLSEKI